VKNEHEQVPLAAAGDGGVEAEISRLMALAKKGDREAFDQLVGRLRGRAFHTALALVGSREDALEQAQEAFLKTWRARDTFRDGEAFLPWFHRILRNTCFSLLRKHGRLKKSSLDAGFGSEGDEGEWDIEGDGASPGEPLEEQERAVHLEQALAGASARDREILAMRHFQDLSYQEIADSLRIPVGTVMSRLFHARRRLRQKLERILGEDLGE
jgi:RNA polymerase sigma-70 factor (ECF subfamily)